MAPTRELAKQVGSCLVSSRYCAVSVRTRSIVGGSMPTAPGVSFKIARDRLPSYGVA